MTATSKRDPRATMGRMVAMRYGNVPHRAILAAETVGTATIDGGEVGFEVQVWAVPSSCADAGTHYLRIWTTGGFRHSWSFAGRRVAACWRDYAETVAGFARDADSITITHELERAPRADEIREKKEAGR